MPLSISAPTCSRNSFSAGAPPSAGSVARPCASVCSLGHQSAQRASGSFTTSTSSVWNADTASLCAARRCRLSPSTSSFSIRRRASSCRPSRMLCSLRAASAAACNSATSDLNISSRESRGTARYRGSRDTLSLTSLHRLRTLTPESDSSALKPSVAAVSSAASCLAAASTSGCTTSAYSFRRSSSEAAFQRGSFPHRLASDASVVVFGMCRSPPSPTASPSSASRSISWCSCSTASCSSSPKPLAATLLLCFFSLRTSSARMRQNLSKSMRFSFCEGTAEKRGSPSSLGSSFSQRLNGVTPVSRSRSKNAASLASLESGRLGGEPGGGNGPGMALAGASPGRPVAPVAGWVGGRAASPISSGSYDTSSSSPSPTLRCAPALFALSLAMMALAASDTAATLLGSFGSLDRTSVTSGGTAQDVSLVLWLKK
mmetsp:Transcript_11639/g.29838  ORF Transcript_11639/g.29838 Transcript_11639/m.29838 type:complete len:430 (+) Transcript_11639:624-1913(+)